MAMKALDSPAAAASRFLVDGSDISEGVLRKARAGVFTARELGDVSDSYRRRFFIPVDERGMRSEAVRALKSIVKFEAVNLCEPATYPARSYDVIFCQNVLIYFRDEIRDRILQSIAGRLSPGGYLLLGPGEVVMLDIAGLRPAHMADSLVFQRAA